MKPRRRHHIAFTPSPRARAFTLVELLAVVAIIGILAAILIPVAGAMRTKARETRCLANLKELGASFFNYMAENRDRTPPACEHSTGAWRAFDTLLGYTENAAAILHCPLDEVPRVRDLTPRSYAMNDPLWQRDRWPGVSPGDMDNPSRTILLSEWFIKGNTIGSESYCDLGNHATTSHANGTRANVLWYDGHVSQVSGNDPDFQNDTYFRFRVQN
ncbi:MAG: prepilin-type N-terminal cleavage/methylation domain-containing protein [Opitutaceae bacterium]|jgi:prepilin-type N-terminal cleavage/methylation domain-containing protein/prepilin-type processing-associated H-X9-DG protein|nr:prepilin-type N-terminal cleavage/methylation domain-containing protein [Opitutaceae bacterium]